MIHIQQTLNRTVGPKVLAPADHLPWAEETLNRTLGSKVLAPADNNVVSSCQGGEASKWCISYIIILSFSGHDVFLNVKVFFPCTMQLNFHQPLLFQKRMVIIHLFKYIFIFYTPRT